MHDGADFEFCTTQCLSGYPGLNQAREDFTLAKGPRIGRAVVGGGRSQESLLGKLKHTSRDSRPPARGAGSEWYRVVHKGDC